MFSGDVVRAVYPEFMEERKPSVPRPRGEAGWFGMKKAPVWFSNFPAASRTTIQSPFKARMAMCRSASHRMAARCPAIESSAF